RITQSLQRRNGDVTTIQQDEALSAIATALQKFSPTEVGVIGSATSCNEDAYITMKFARAVLSTNNVDFPGRTALMPTYVELLSHADRIPLLCTLPDVADADVILCIGIGASNRYPQVTARIFRSILNGRHMLLVDTWHSDFAPYASLHLTARPYADAVWLMALAGLIDPTISQPYTADEVQAVTGITEEQLQSAAQLLREGKRIAAIYDTASLLHMSNPESVRALVTLMNALKSAGAEWCGILPMVERCNSNGVLQMGMAPAVLPCLRALTDDEVSHRLNDAWGRGVPRAPGLSVEEMLTAVEREELKALIVIGDDLLTCGYDQNALKGLLDKLELLVAITAFETPIAEIAHFVLPRTIPGESEGTYVNMEGRVRRVQRVVESTGEARQEWQILTALSQRLGYEMRYGNSQDVLNEIKQVAPAYQAITLEAVAEGEFIVRDGLGMLNHSSEGASDAERLEVRELPATTSEFPVLLLVERYYLPWFSDALALHASTLRREYRLRFTPYVFVNSTQGHELGLRDGMPALMKSAAGEVRVTSIFSDAVPANIAILPQMFFPELKQILGEVTHDERTGAPIYPAISIALERAR
ncbi:MAG TPA: hypothetical protein EYP10_11915, partial [Armatimonadetes bacterium]|nr:hypothetical protein [Armatimonadota bacterium]